MGLFFFIYYSLRDSVDVILNSENGIILGNLNKINEAINYNDSLPVFIDYWMKNPDDTLKELTEDDLMVLSNLLLEVDENQDIATRFNKMNEDGKKCMRILNMIWSAIS